VSAQAWGIFPKIRNVDESLRARPHLQQIVREVHPEVSFWAWNGSRPITGGKKTLDGMIARLRLVESHFGPSAFRQVRDASRHKDVGDDDILDAFAALWTAERLARNEATVLSGDPRVDSVGLRMEIVY
jgi:predicted RNase H-like nuclease